MRLHDLFENHAREIPNTEFAVMEDCSVTYQEANEQTNRLANAFSSVGLQKGDRVAVLSKNSIEYVILYYAASKSGVVPVPLNYRLAPSEWAYIINDSQSKMLISSAEFLEAADGIRGELENVSRFVSIGASKTGVWTDYQEWVDGQPATPPDQTIAPGDDLTQMCR